MVLPLQSFTYSNLSSDYECMGGSLEKNIAFLALKRMAEQEQQALKALEIGKTVNQ